MTLPHSGKCLFMGHKLFYQMTCLSYKPPLMTYIHDLLTIFNWVTHLISYRGSNMTLPHSGKCLFMGHKLFYQMTCLSYKPPLMTYIHDLLTFFNWVTHLISYRGSNMTLPHSGKCLFMGHKLFYQMTCLSYKPPLMTYIHDLLMFFNWVTHLISYRGSNMALLHSSQYLFIGCKLSYRITCLS